MKFKPKTIFTGFAPNLTFKDVVISLSFLCLPWNWKKIIIGKNADLAEVKIENYFNVKYCSIFDSGRSALFFALKALGVGAGDEVLVQAYTCMVVVNAIKWTGAKPIFIDIDNDFNIVPSDLEKKISNRAKVLIIQHTFGLPATLNKLLEIANSKKLKVVEDCAHAYGAKYKDKLVGTFGDIGLLSFGSDKILSCVRGGALITDSRELGDAILVLQNNLPHPKLRVTLQHLMHGPVFFKGKLLYRLYVGKIILYLAKKLNLINKIIYSEEKQGLPDKFYSARLANALAEILLVQLDQVDEVNKHRKLIAEYYKKNINNNYIEHSLLSNDLFFVDCVFLRYPILCNEPARLLKYAKARGVILGNWYNTVIAPKDIDLSKTDYLPGSCPNAEVLASRSVNLPTNRHVSLEDAARVAQIVNEYKYGN